MDAASRKIAQAILAVQEKKGLSKSWGLAEHASLLATRTLEVIESEVGKLEWTAEERKDVKAALRKAYIADGLGGNSSQFRGKLVKLGDLPESAEAASIDYDEEVEADEKE